MSALTQRGNLGYLIAGIGAIVSLIGLLFLPYVVYQITVSILGITQSRGGNYGISDVAGGLGYGIIWLAALLTVVAAVVAGLRIFASNMFNATNSFARIAPIIIIVCGVVSLLIQIWVGFDANHKVQDVLNAAGGGIFSNAITATVGYGIGGWFYLAGTIVIIVGGILALIFKPAFVEVSAQQGVPEWPASSPVPPWPPAQYPSSQTPQTQYPQQQQQYPPQAYPGQSEQYPQQQPPPQW